MSKVGIVILNYNDYEETYKFVESIKDFKVLNEIIVVDNASTDGSLNILKKLENKKIKVIGAKENEGYSSGNNLGIKELGNRVDYIIISNPDITVSEKTIKKLKDDLDEDPSKSLIAPVVKQQGKEFRGWRLPNYTDELLSNINYVQRKAKEKLYYDESKYTDEFTRVEAVSGCFFMIRRDVLNLIGNFDDSTFLYYEENILGKKLETINKSSYIDNTVSVNHNLSVSVDKSFNSINKYKMLKKSQKYYVKYYLKINIFGIILLEILYGISLGISYIICFFRNIRRKK